MKISAKGEYAYRSVYELARYYLTDRDAVLQLEEIASRQKIPRKYLVQILLQLKKAGLVGARRGASGGYYLRRPPSQITLGEVLELVDGPMSWGIRAGEVQGVSGRDELATALMPVFDQVQQCIRQSFHSLDFEEICRRAQNTSSNMYFI